MSLLLPQDQVEWEERPQTVDDVKTLLGNINAFWTSRPRQRVFSDSMDLCDRLLPTMDTHATLLSVLPDALSYTPLFYGVLQSVIKVGNSDFMARTVTDTPPRLRRITHESWKA